MNDTEYPYSEHRAKQHKKKSSKTKWIILAIVAVIVIVAAIIICKFMNDINNPQALFEQSNPTDILELEATPNVTATPNAEALPTPVPTVDPEAALSEQADADFMKNRVNILLLGIDESTERANWGSFRTDTMILVTINFDTHDVDMISVPRDSYVKIRNGSGHVLPASGSSDAPMYAKINSAFSKGGGSGKNGYQYAMGTVSGLLGVPVEYYMAFNMNVVKEIVNAMDGVDYNVDIDVKMNGRTLSPGFQHLDGQQVLDYCRMRKGSSDIARVERQQKMLTAIFHQLKSSGQIGNIPSIYQALEQNIETNLNFTQIASLALMALRMDMDQLNTHTVEGEFLDINGVSYWGLSASKLQSLIKDVFGISIARDEDIDASTVKQHVKAVGTVLPNDELNAANEALKAADRLKNAYHAWFTADTANQLQMAIDRVNEAIREGDTVAMAANAAALRAMCQGLEAQLAAYGATMPNDDTNASSNVDSQPPQVQQQLPQTDMIPAA